MDPQRVLFDRPVPHNGSETSKAGAEFIAPKAGTQLEMVLACIKAHGPMSDSDVMRRTGLPINMVTARRRRLELDGWIAQVGTKKSRVGVLNKLWECVAEKHEM